MEKIWLKSYEEGIPEFIDVTRYQTIIDVFQKSVAQYGERDNLPHIYKTY